MTKITMCLNHKNDDIWYEAGYILNQTVLSCNLIDKAIILTAHMKLDFF